MSSNFCSSSSISSRSLEVSRLTSPSLRNSSNLACIPGLGLFSNLVVLICGALAFICLTMASLLAFACWGSQSNVPEACASFLAFLGALACSQLIHCSPDIEPSLWELTVSASGDVHLTVSSPNGSAFIGMAGLVAPLSIRYSLISSGVMILLSYNFQASRNSACFLRHLSHSRSCCTACCSHISVVSRTVISKALLLTEMVTPSRCNSLV